MRILIIGGTRFIGPPVVRRLHDQGHTIWLFHRSQTKIALPSGVNHILGDRYQLGDFRDDFRRARPDVVIDMIPLAQADAQAVVEVFKEISGRLVAASSQDVYRAYGRVNGSEPGEPDPIPLTEDSPLRANLYPYRGETPRTSDDPRLWMDDYDKILVERVVMENGAIPGTVLLAVENMRAKLRAGGLLLISIRDYDHLLLSKPRATLPEVIEGQGGRRIVFQVWDWSDMLYTLTLFIVQQGDPAWHTMTYRATYRAVVRADLNAALEQAGFTDLRWHMPQDTGYHQPILIAKS